MARDGWLFRRRERQPAGPEPAAPTRTDFRLDVSEDGDLAAELAETLRMIRAAGGELPGLAWSRLRIIVDLLDGLIAHVAGRGASAEQSVLLHSVAGEYVRDPLQAYLGIARGQRGPGSEADDLLVRQLAVLESATRDLDGTIRSGSLAELDLHGRFLAERFMVSELEGGR